MIVNLTPSNTIQKMITGDLGCLPVGRPWCMVILENGEVVVCTPSGIEEVD